MFCWRVSYILSLSSNLMHPLSALYFIFQKYAFLYSQPVKFLSCQIVLTSFVVLPVFHNAFLSISPGPDRESTTCRMIYVKNSNSAKTTTMIAIVYVAVYLNLDSWHSPGDKRCSYTVSFISFLPWNNNKSFVALVVEYKSDIVIINFIIYKQSAIESYIHELVLSCKKNIYTIHTEQIGQPLRMDGWLCTCCMISDPLLLRVHKGCRSELPGWFLASDMDLNLLKFAIWIRLLHGQTSLASVVPSASQSFSQYLSLCEGL